MGQKERIALPVGAFLVALVVPARGLCFVRGDANGDGQVNLGDTVAVLSYVFEGQSETACVDSLDVEDDGAVTLSDAVALLEYLFHRGPPPAPPFPESGWDPTPRDAYTCGDREGVSTRSRYVRAGARGSGSGTDWFNAFPRLPPRPERGVTYYVAAGTYPAWTFETPEQGSSVVTVKRASDADHGTDAGWDPAYGRGPARFPSLVIASSYLTLDGVFGVQGKGQYGFEVYNEAPPQQMVWLVVLSEGVTGVHIRKLEAHRKNRDHRGRGLYAAFGGNGTISLVHCYFHDLHGVHCYFLNAKDVLIDHCVFARNKSTPLLHSESIQARHTVGLTVCYSYFEDIEGTGVIVSGSGDSARWRIYGNVFTATPSFRGGVGHATVSDNFRGSIGDVLVCNNTFWGIRAGKTGVRFYNGRGLLYAYNNLYVDCAGVGYVGVEHDFDLYVGCTFTEREFSRAAGDLLVLARAGEGLLSGEGRLLRPTEAGIALPAPFHRDPDGRLRGNDGVWDRGAYEYSEP